MNNILWVPLDLPLPPKELTLKKLQDHYTFVPNLSEKGRIDLEKQKKHHLYAWNSFRIHVPSGETENPYETQVDDVDWNWTTEAQVLCPQLIEYIKQYLPFKKFKYITAISSNGSVPLHLDLTDNLTEEEKLYYKENDPCFYRLLLDGEMHKDSFYVYTKSLGKVYCTVPDSSPGWAMGSYSCAHGNDETVPNQKLLLYVMGDLDLERHQDLIDRSYKIYKEFAVVKEYGL
jgi:hypothetical protein